MKIFWPESEFLSQRISGRNLHKEIFENSQTLLKVKSETLLRRTFGARKKRNLLVSHLLDHIDYHLSDLIISPLYTKYLPSYKISTPGLGNL